MTVIDWLLDADPAIRWQVQRDLRDGPPDVLARERARVATEGWGAKLLALQDERGYWAGAAWSRDWTDTMHSLELLRLFGLDPHSGAARAAIAKVKAGVIFDSPWHNPWDGNAFFQGEVEPCINGVIVGLGGYFGEATAVAPLVDRLLGEELGDGGWNCEVENGAVVSSFGTTIRVVEGLLEYDRAIGGSAPIQGALHRAHEYLLDRKLFRRRSTGEVIRDEWLQFSFPFWHFYDVLRGLDHLRDAGHDPGDPRLSEALDLVESRRQPDGRWLLENVHPGEMPFELEGGAGEPSRWNTLRALRVLRWAAAGDGPQAVTKSA